MRRLQRIAGSARTDDRKRHVPFFPPARVQPKLTIGEPGDVYEREADAVADTVMRLPHSADGRVRPREDAPAVQRQESALDDRPAPDLRLSTSSLLQPTTQPDFLALRRPFFDRSVPHLWDPDSALGVWSYNFGFFRRFGLSPDLSASLTNLTAPRFIDAQLRANHPTWWEITDRDLGTSTLGASIPVLDFDPNFAPRAPSWLRSIFGGSGGVQQRAVPSIQRLRIASGGGGSAPGHGPGGPNRSTLP
jgi:hypothetical protein